MSNTQINLEGMLLLPIFNEKIKLSNQERNVAPSYVRRTFLSRKMYDDLFNSSVQRLSKYLINSHKVEYKDEFYVIFSIPAYNKPAVLLTSDFDRSNLKNVELVQEIDSNYFQMQGGLVLNKLLEKYVKGNYIIPYDFETRKKMYKEAFNELKEFMS